MAIFDRIAVFGCKATTLFLLDSLRIPYPVRHLITIAPEKGQQQEVADYLDLKEAAEARGIEVYQAKTYSLKNEADQAHIRSLGIDIAFVIGWQRLIPSEVLSGFRIGAFGMHGSSMNLPLGRGRSPMNWSIIEGRQVFYTNLFKYDPGVDSGDIVDTFKFQITPQDTAETMHFKNTMAMKYLIERNIERLVSDKFKAYPQDDSITPTYYPKRTPADSLINWEMDVHALERFVRAVTRPFNGAFTYAGEQQVTILRAQVFDHEDFGYISDRIGTVVAVFPNGKFLVKCYGGLLLVHEWETDAEIRAGVQFHNHDQNLKHFGRNEIGYFDLPE
jgi:UDP-4-amino-4-deoxy-L-arabinose formyltransferase/UDP-glucuronic acid dehydrogenase (UDP-4-keto-hexauronic acid decarboxylating)